jgi:hypothetical protein
MNEELVTKYRRLVDADFVNAGVGPMDEAELRRRLRIIATEEGLIQQIAFLEVEYPAVIEPCSPSSMPVY